jgi:hypothetical protein
MFENPKKGGSVKSKWRLGFVDASTHNMVYFGQEFQVEFEVKNENALAQYEKHTATHQEITVAKTIHEMFPNLDFLNILQRVTSHPGKTIEELIELFMASN